MVIQKKNPFGSMISVKHRIIHSFFADPKISEKGQSMQPKPH